MLAIIPLHISVKMLIFLHPSLLPPLSRVSEHAAQRGHLTTSQFVLLLNLSSRDETTQQSWIPGREGGFSSIRASLTLTLVAYTGSRGRSVLRHITVSIWHCLLCLVPTQHTRLCANNPPTIQANRRRRGTGLLAAGKADAWSASKTEQRGEA